MRRLARHLFTLCSAVSLLLCVATCVLWPRSYFRADWFPAVPRADALRFDSWQGRLFIIQVRWPGELYVVMDPPVVNGVRFKRWDRPGFRQAVANLPSVTPPSAYIWPAIPANGFGFDYNVFRFGPGSDVLTVSIPYWFVFFATALPPTVWVLRRRRLHRRVARGLCVSCGYDLRASPERCPECGTLAATAV